jgi:hypothetical protein
MQMSEIQAINFSAPYAKIYAATDDAAEILGRTVTESIRSGNQVELDKAMSFANSFISFRAICEKHAELLGFTLPVTATPASVSQPELEKKRRRSSRRPGATS